MQCSSMVDIAVQQPTGEHRAKGEPEDDDAYCGSAVDGYSRIERCFGTRAAILDDGFRRNFDHQHNAEWDDEHIVKISE